MIRIVHTADLHFDSPFSALPYEISKQRKEEQYETFRRIIEFVRSNNVDILLIAGDLFDSRYLSVETIEFLKDCFLQISNVPVFISPGNHDYIDHYSQYKSVEWGNNVHVFGEKLEKIQMDKAVIYGSGFGTRYVNESLLPPSFLHNENKPGILVLHGDIGRISDYNPIDEMILKKSRLSYAALGHIHSFSGILKAGKTSYAYCGIPEGRYFDECEECGFIFGEISETISDLKFIPFSKRKNHVIHIDVSNFSTFKDILTEIRMALKEDDLYKFYLEGEINHTFFLDVNLLEKELSGDCFYIKIVDATKIRKENIEENILEKLFLERLSNREDDIADLAIRFGLEALRRQKH